MARSIRDQPFCWQEKKICRLLNKQFKKSELVKMRCLYQTITQIDSDFNGKDIKFFTKTISTYSGLSTAWIPRGLKKLQDLGIVRLIQDVEKGRFKGKRLIFTPENVIEDDQKTVSSKPGNGEYVNGKSITSEDSSFLEESFLQEKKEDILREPQNGSSPSPKPKKVPWKNSPEPMSRVEFCEEMSNNKSKHMQIIGWFAGEIQKDFGTKGQWEQFIRRHVRAASQLRNFSPKQIVDAAKEVQARDYQTEWTLETLLKHLTNGKVRGRERGAVV